MIQHNTSSKTNQVIADVSQYTRDAGRLSAEQRLQKINQERAILVTRQKELQVKLLQYKTSTPHGRTAGTAKVARNRVLKELADIQARLVEIKPTRKQLSDQLHRDPSTILEDILAVLKDIAYK